jgi:hypothetical protein
MTDDDPTPQAKRYGYWEDVEADAATVVDHLHDDADDWDILAVDVAGEAEDGRVLFLLVIRRKVSDDGNLIVSERYYRFDVTDREGSWLSNGIERRVNGSLATALKVLYSALVNGDLSDDDPMLMDSRGDGLEYDCDALREPVRDLRRDDDSDGEPEGRDPRLKESASGRTTQTVTCEECGGEVPREDAINLGGALGVDMWVCDGTHIEEGEDA